MTDTDGSNTHVAVANAWSASLAFSRDGSQLAYAGDSGVEVLDLVGGGQQHIRDGQVSHLAFSWDSAAIAVASTDGFVEVRSPVDGSLVHTINASANNRYNTVSYSPDGSLFIGVGESNVDFEFEYSIVDPRGQISARFTVPAETINLPAWVPCAGGSCPGPPVISAPCTVVGTSGNDTLTGTAGNDVFCAGTGNDRVLPSGGSDIVRGGLGSDTLDLRNAPAGVAADLTTGVVSGWGTSMLASVENVLGTRYADNLTGNADRNTLNGYARDDKFVGRAGDDTLSGGDGNDHLRGEAGDDDLSGGYGQDLVSFADSPRRVRISLANGTASGNGSDLLLGNERVQGSRYDDFIIGSGGADVIRAGGGSDTVEAGAGNDTIYGEDAKDYLHGQGGNDRIDGGTGNDYVNGGGGTDRCYSAYVSRYC